jgi:hypothetical protein
MHNEENLNRQVQAVDGNKLWITPIKLRLLLMSVTAKNSWIAD